MAKSTDDMLKDISDYLNQGVDVTIPRKAGVVLFGSVIAANVATVFVLAGLTAVAKRFVTKVEDVAEEPTLGEKVAEKTADILERGAQHLKRVD